MSNLLDAITNASGGRAAFFALCAMILLPAVSHADEFDPEEFSCRASPLFVEALGAEPFIANAPAVPCADDSAGLLPPGAFELDGISATALSAVTEFGEGSGPGTVANSSSSTAHVRIEEGNTDALFGTSAAPLVEATILQADASVEATPQGDCKLRSESFVGSVIVQGQIIDVDGEPREIPLGPVGTLFLNWTQSEDRDGDGFDDKVTQRALFLDSGIIGDVVVSEAIADFEAADACAENGNGNGGREGLMTGGGRFSDDDAGQRVTHGFRLECSVEDGPNRLQVNWGNGNSFHLLEMSEAVCSDDPAIDPGQPHAEFDTHDGQGTGRLRSKGASTDEQGTAQWTFTDAGEPGFEDTASITIRDSEGAVVLRASGSLVRGNHQAHMRPSKANGAD